MNEQVNQKAEDVAANDFQEKVLNSDKPVLVDFWAEWCMPCLMMAPVLDDVAREMSDKVTVLKLNTESEGSREWAIKYDIRSIPNMKLFHKGEVVHEFIGFRPKEVFQQELEEALNKIA